MTHSVRSMLVAMLCAASVTAQFVGSKATRDALFLSSLGFENLPAMLIATSVWTLLVVWAYTSWTTKMGTLALVQASFAASGLLFIGEWALRLASPGASAVLLYLHTSGAGPLLTSGFWLIATERFDPHTARRRFGQIAGAGTLGGLVGALLSERVAALVGAPAMLIVLAGLQFLTVWLVSLLARSGDRAPAWTDAEARPAAFARTGLRGVAAAPHLRHLAVLVLLATTSAALVDYLFKVKAVETFGPGDQLLRFFALYYAATGLAAFILQAAAGQAVLERFGIGLAASSPAIALVAGSLGGMIAPGFGGLFAARAGESIFRASWFRAGYEVFYTPIPAAEKRAAKAVIDVGADRLGDAVGAALVQLSIVMAPAAQSSLILALSLATAVLAIVASTRLNRLYVNTLGRSLMSQAANWTRTLMLTLPRTGDIRVSQHIADALMTALENDRFEVRFQSARSLSTLLERHPRIEIDRVRVFAVVLKEVAVSRPVWESRRLLDVAAGESPLDEFVRDRAGQSLAHVFTLLSLVLPRRPLLIAFKGLHSNDPRLHGTALEYLEGVLPAPIRQHLWPFLVGGRVQRPSQPRTQVIAELLRSSPSATVRLAGS